MRTPHTDIPATGDQRISARAASPIFPPTSIVCFANDNLPDHGDLLANVVRWAAKESIPLVVHGVGLLNCELYRQENRLILHVLNLTSAGTWRAPIHDLILVGPFQIKVRLPENFQASKFKTLVARDDEQLHGRVEAGWACFDLKTVLDHEVVVIES